MGRSAEGTSRSRWKRGVGWLDSTIFKHLKNWLVPLRSSKQKRHEGPTKKEFSNGRGQEG